MRLKTSSNMSTITVSICDPNSLANKQRPYGEKWGNVTSTGRILKTQWHRDIGNKRTGNDIAIKYYLKQKPEVAVVNSRQNILESFIRDKRESLQKDKYCITILKFHQTKI